MSLKNGLVFFGTNPSGEMQWGSNPGGQYSRMPPIKYSATSASMTCGASLQVGKLGSSQLGTSADAIGNESLPSKIIFVAMPMSGKRLIHVDALDATLVTSNNGISLSSVGKTASVSVCAVTFLSPSRRCFQLICSGMKFEAVGGLCGFRCIKPFGLCTPTTLSPRM
eukprot:3637868-Rhodomonas_salina.1